MRHKNKRGANTGFVLGAFAPVYGLFQDAGRDAERARWQEELDRLLADRGKTEEDFDSNVEISQQLSDPVESEPRTPVRHNER